MNHELIDLLVEEFVNEDIEIVTAAGKTLNAKQLNDYNTVKVMVDRDKFATAFRRDPIEMESEATIIMQEFMLIQKALWKSLLH